MGVVDNFKIPVERTVYLMAALIPGSMALVIYQQASGTTFQHFWAISFLGYKTKLGLLAFLAFVIGHSITNFVRGLLDDFLPVGAEFLGRIPWPSKSSFEYETAPLA